MIKEMVLPQNASNDVPWTKGLLPTQATTELSLIEDKNLRDRTRWGGWLEYLGYVTIVAAGIGSNPPCVILGFAGIAAGKLLALPGIEAAWQKEKEQRGEKHKMVLLKEAKRAAQEVQEAQEFTGRWDKIFAEYFGHDWTENFRLSCNLWPFSGDKGIYHLYQKYGFDEFHFHEAMTGQEGWFYQQMQASSNRIHVKASNWDWQGSGREMRFHPEWPDIENFPSWDKAWELNLWQGKEKSKLMTKFDAWVQDVSDVKPKSLTISQLLDMTIKAVRDIHQGELIYTEVAPDENWKVTALTSAGFKKSGDYFVLDFRNKKI